MAGSLLFGLCALALVTGPCRLRFSVVNSRPFSLCCKISTSETARITSGERC